MNKDRDDERLSQAFQALRSETGRAGRVPDFDAMMGEAKRRAEKRPELGIVHGGAPLRARRRLVRLGAWASAAVAATVVGPKGRSAARAGEIVCTAAVEQGN